MIHGKNSSVQDVTQAVSRTFYVMDMKQRAGFFFHDSQFFLYHLEILKLLFFSISDSFCVSEGQTAQENKCPVLVAAIRAFSIS